MTKLDHANEAEIRRPLSVAEIIPDQTLSVFDFALHCDYA